jgi:hypothetical protein
MECHFIARDDTPLTTPVGLRNLEEINHDNDISRSVRGIGYTFHSFHTTDSLVHAV